MQRLAPAQVWSNPQAVEDYQALLSGVVPVVTDDMASVIVLGTSPEERRLGLFLNKINTRGDDQVLEVGALAGSPLWRSEVSSPAGGPDLAPDIASRRVAQHPPDGEHWQRRKERADCQIETTAAALSANPCSRC